MLWCLLFLRDPVHGSIVPWRVVFDASAGGVDAGMIDLQKLFTDVFDPQPDETALVLLDTPHGQIADTPAWAERREMAQRWYQALAQLGSKRRFRILPLVRIMPSSPPKGFKPTLRWCSKIWRPRQPSPWR